MPSFPRWLASLVVVLVCGSSLLAQGSEPFVPARLAPPSGDGSMLLARGLWCARQGDLTRSLELAKLARDAAPGDERVQRGLKIYYDAQTEGQAAWELALVSPTRFARFAAYQIASML